MNPSDLGLPPKFKSFRRGQLDAILDIAASEKRFTLLSSPTGSGKSLIAASISRLITGRTLYLTSTKGLQAQVINDFTSIGAKDIRGQNNYKCLAVEPDGELAAFGSPNTGCHEGPCHEGGKDICVLHERGCTYYDAVRVAAKAPLVITNYRYWMTINRFSDPDTIGQFDLLVLDEAHNAPDELADFCTVNLDRTDVREMLGMALPSIEDGDEAWIDWASVALKTARVRYAKARQELNSPGHDRRTALSALRRLTKMGRDLKELSKAHSWRDSEPASPDVYIPGTRVDWVPEHTSHGIKFSPIWAHAYAEEYLFKGIKKIVLVSATLQPRVATYLGISPNVSEFREHASTFDPKKRPFVWVPTTRVDRAMTDGQVRVWVNKMDAIIAKRQNVKGIIHSRSYDRAAEIMRRSKHKDILLTHTKLNTREIVEKFKRAKAPCVLVSPSVGTGYDFPYDECRYQIIAKVPFVDMRSEVLKARVKSDKRYSNYLTALELIQQTGRGMRAEDDSCETFVLDDHIEWFMAAARKMNLFPRWFMMAYHKIQGVP